MQMVHRWRDGDRCRVPAVNIIGARLQRFDLSLSCAILAGGRTGLSQRSLEKLRQMIVGRDRIAGQDFKGDWTRGSGACPPRHPQGRQQRKMGALRGMT